MDEFFPDPILFAGTPFEVNRIQLVRLIILAAVLIFMCIVASRSKLVPGRVQSVVEMLVEFVHKNIVVNVLGEKDGRRFGPWLITVFVREGGDGAGVAGAPANPAARTEPAVPAGH